jgi:hypothetical protein
MQEAGRKNSKKPPAVRSAAKSCQGGREILLAFVPAAW